MSDPVPLHPSDVAILACLSDHGPEVEPLVASRTGLHRKVASRRCGALLAAGYIREHDAGYYDLAERGVRYLDGTDGAAGGRPASVD